MWAEHPQHKSNYIRIMSLWKRESCESAKEFWVTATANLCIAISMASSAPFKSMDAWVEKIPTISGLPAAISVATVTVEPRRAGDRVSQLRFGGESFIFRLKTHCYFAFELITLISRTRIPLQSFPSASRRLKSE